MTNERPDLSIVTTFFNEEEVIPELIRRLHSCIAPLQLQYEIIFVNDSSTDRSVEVIQEHMKTNPRIRLLNMSRNFGLCWRT